MTTITRTLQELEALLHEQLEFLDASGRAFDNGFSGEIKRLATAVRVLVHDTTHSTSLLSLLGKKSGSFLDTADPYDDENLMPHSSLVTVHMCPNRVEATAHFDDLINQRSVSFDEWWDGIVLVDDRHEEFSRRDICLYLANKEGGAHVDAKIDEKYERLRKANAAGWIMGNDPTKTIHAGDHVPATMRQISHELLKSLRPDYSYAAAAPSDRQLSVRGLSMKRGSEVDSSNYPNLRKGRPEVNGKKIGRNDLCYCGSGKKYKKCCL